MREGWIEKRFDEVFTLQMGKTPDRKNKAFFEGTNTWVSIKDLGDKYILSSHECISDEAATNISIVKKGTVIMSFKLTVGKCAIAAKDLYTNEAIMAFNTKDGYEINSSFLYYYLKGYKWNGANKAVMGLTLNKATISKHNLSIPPLSTQQSIVSELDKINELIRLKKEQLKDYDNLAQSIFYEMFGDPVVNEKGWEVKKLGELGTIVTGSTPSTKIKEYYCSNDYCFIKPSDLPAEGYQIIVESENYISSKGYEVSRKLPKGSVLVSCIGIIGKTAILGMDACTNQQINAIIPNEYVNNKFLAYSILSQRYVLSSVANAPVVPLINKSDFSKVEIPLPPLPLQQVFAQRIELIEKQKAEVQRTIADLETLLASRMQYWFD